jgi:DNA-binding beta-propeller fold protein YncE
MIRARAHGVRAVLVVGCVLVGALVLACAPALAARGHVLGGSFGKPCMSEPCAPGKLKEPAGVAVNEATGDVYVLDKGNDRVEVFNAAGTKLEGELNGSGSLSGEVTPAPTGQFLAPNAIALDNSCALHKPVLTELTTPSCHESDPSGGDVYVADAGHSVIDKFSAAGEYLGQIMGTEVCEKAGEGLPCSGSKLELVPFGKLEGAATDAAGQVWVYQGSGEIDSFSEATNEFLSSRGSEAEAKGFPEPGLAVDAKDNLYVVYKYAKLVAELNTYRTSNVNLRNATKIRRTLHASAARTSMTPPPTGRRRSSALRSS